MFTLGSLEEDLEKAEDGGKSWSCEGQEERVSLSDIGWLRSRDGVYTLKDLRGRDECPIHKRI